MKTQGRLQRAPKGITALWVELVKKGKKGQIAVRALRQIKVSLGDAAGENKKGE